MNEKNLRNSAGIRLVIIAAMSLLLLIPAMMVRGIIEERRQRKDRAVLEVSSKWGRPQTIAGPILTIPYKKYHKNSKGKIYTTLHYAHFLPNRLSIEGTLKPQIRYRGIYEVILYGSKLHVVGNFSLPPMKSLNIPQQNVIWKDAVLSVGITDMKGINDTLKITWNNRRLIANPGTQLAGALPSGISAKAITDQKNRKYSFAMDIQLNGSEQIHFVPLGKETTVTVSSNWHTPSFVGEFLPASRQIEDDRFSATWNVLHLNRNYPQIWLDKDYPISPSAFGVKFLTPVDEYQKTMRTAKYALMFIVLTFLSFFMIEIMGGKTIHPVQYSLIGLALIIFYTLLLSLSEHILFQYSYGIASVCIVTIITAYAKSVLSSKRFATVIGGVLASLYTFMYVILQLEDYALLLGSVGLFGILALVMYLTRKLDWFAVLKNEKGQIEP